MPETAALDLDLPIAPPRPASRARDVLLRRLADVVCLPESRVNTFERSMTADLLVEMLSEAAISERVRIARRLAHLTEIPHALLRLLLADAIEVAGPLIENCAGIGDCDLIACAVGGGIDHRVLIAQRRGVSETVGAALVERLEPPVVDALLRNTTARVAADAVEALVSASRDQPAMVGALMRRPELRPHHAYAMFWWADTASRKAILQRFAVSREILQDAAGDVFGIAAAEGWSDPLSRMALQFIERRQRNRAAIEKSPFGSLDEAVAAAEPGMSRKVAEEIAYLAGIKPMTAAKIFTDAGGEPLAILCKATGLPRHNVISLWRGLRRPETNAEGARLEGLERALITYDMIAVDRAQTVLRYWNWSLSSAFTPAMRRALRDGEDEVIANEPLSRRIAMLALKSNLDA